MDAKRLLTALLCALLAIGGLLSPSRADEAATAGGPPPGAAGGAAAQADLADQQQQVAERYRRLEELLLRLADVEADENPERAGLLRRAAKQSRDTFVLDRLNTASQSLRSQQYKNAVDSQKSGKEGLDRMLSLLLSEDRPQRIRDEKQRVGKMIKELKLVERLQRSTRARTENGGQLDALSEEQQQIGQRAEQVRQSLREDTELDAADDAPSADGDEADAEAATESAAPSGDAAEESPAPQDPQDSAAGDPGSDTAPAPAADQGEPSEPAHADEPAAAGEPAEPGQSAAPEPSAESGKPGEPNPSKPSDGAPAQSSPAPSTPPADAAPPSPAAPSDGATPPAEGSAGQPEGGAQQPPADQGPASPEQQAEQQLQQAIERMKQAEQELEQSKREGAVEQQQQAEEKLRAAIDRLERILRQLREEEMQRELARLEARLRRMAQMQAKVLDDTKLLEAIPQSQRDRQFDVRAGNLAFEEKKIVMEADRALLLLREEGSSVAFPEVVAQIRGDMQRVADRLTASKLDAVTLGLQDDILAALEEMIAALQKAQRDLEKQRQEGQPPQPSQPGQGPGEQPLVEQLAELKLIRTMETRIMTTTKRYAELLEQSDAAEEILPLVRELAQRQNKLYRVTRDLVRQRNQ